MGGPPPPPAAAATQDVYLPGQSGVIDGGAALQAYSGGRVGDASALRSQITLGQLARECNGQADGSTLVKVGVEGRALLGASGSAGRFDVPVRIVVKRGSTVFAEPRPGARRFRSRPARPRAPSSSSRTASSCRRRPPRTSTIEVGLGGGPAGGGAAARLTPRRADDAVRRRLPH